MTEEIERISGRKYQEVDLNDIEVDTLNNVRTEGRRLGFEALKLNIEKIGLIHPVVLVPNKDKTGKKFKLIVGQRRFTVFQELKNKNKEYEKIPAIIITNEIDDLTKRVISFSENTARGRLPYNDTIRVVDELFNSYGGPKSERLQRIANDIGVNIQTVVRYLSYRIIPEDVRKMVDDRKLDRTQAQNITAIFWPKSEKIVKIAKYMIGMTKPEWENLLDVGMEKPAMSFEELVEEAKKPSRKIRVIVRLDRDDFVQLKSMADKDQNKMEISDFINNIVKDWLKGSD